MLATSTHDTKRSEDVRARLAVLSEIPERWADAVRRWQDRNQRHRTGEWPDPAAEYFLYQTLVGAWPLNENRAVAYMEKATKEAKTHTSWTDPDPSYDDAVRAFVRAVVTDEGFGEELRAFVEPLLPAARVTSLAQQLVKLTAPGVPDVYQGTEIEDLSLVDPDNRRPVDFARRRALLATLGDDKIKVTATALRLRRQRPDLLGPGAAYARLPAHGVKAEHAVAFLRGEGCAVVAPRLVVGLGADWGDTTVELPDGAWRDELTGAELAGGTVPIAHVLAGFAVALLVRR
jgi:(1->4)-alpha-D-glucan 1-alpha-D-glucosylmutase